MAELRPHPLARSFARAMAFQTITAGAPAINSLIMRVVSGEEKDRCSTLESVVDTLRYFSGLVCARARIALLMV